MNNQITNKKLNITTSEIEEIAEECIRKSIACPQGWKVLIFINQKGDLSFSSYTSNNNFTNDPDYVTCIKGVSLHEWQEGIEFDEEGNYWFEQDPSWKMPYEEMVSEVVSNIVMCGTDEYTAEFEQIRDFFTQNKKCLTCTERELEVRQGSCWCEKEENCDIVTQEEEA